MLESNQQVTLLGRFQVQNGQGPSTTKIAKFHEGNRFAGTSSCNLLIFSD